MRWLGLVVLLLAGCDHTTLPGTACTKHEQCTGLKNGYCSKAEICTRACSDAVPCPEAFSTCTDVGGRSVCLPVCADDTNCVTGFACRERVCVRAQPMEPPSK